MNELSHLVQKSLGIRLSQAQLNMLSQYENALIEWNSRFNLTSIREVGEIRIKHFLDSLTCLIAIRNTPMENIIDVGSGAGFPGLPLKILQPNIHLTLIESVGKKASFLRYVTELLELDYVEVIQERAEVVAQLPKHRQVYDWALARAVANLPVLVEYLLPFVRVSGSALAMKGENAPVEVQSAERACRILGGHVRKLIPVTLPGVVEERYLVVIDKIAATPPAYPRHPGTPSKKPL